MSNHGELMLLKNLKSSSKTVFLFIKCVKNFSTQKSLDGRLSFKVIRSPRRASWLTHIDVEELFAPRYEPEQSHLFLVSLSTLNRSKNMLYIFSVPFSFVCESCYRLDYRVILNPDSKAISKLLSDFPSGSFQAVFADSPNIVVQFQTGAMSTELRMRPVVAR